MANLFRPGEMIIELRPEMVGKANPLGLATSILELLAMLKREHGAVKIQTLWPVGVSVVQGVTGWAAFLLPLVLKKLPANVRPFATELLAGATAGGDPELANEARLRLRITLPPKEDVAAVLKKVVTYAGVAYAEPVPYIFSPVTRARSDAERDAAFPPPPDSSGAFAVKPEGFWPTKAIDRPASWDDLGLRNIAILDSGCDANHPGLQDAVDYANPESATDADGHGTFIANIIAGREAVASWDLGLDPGAVSDTPTGMLPGSRLWMANVMDPTPYYDENGNAIYTLEPGVFSRELNRLAKRKTARLQEIQVLNLSLGSTYESTTMKKDIKAVQDKGIIVVAAAGNTPKDQGFPDPVLYPAAYPRSISVGAIAFDGGSGNTMWPRTNSDLSELNRDLPWDICAPGEWILSGLPMEENSLGLTFSGWLSGTSMAAAYVTAVVAVLRSQGMKDRDSIVDYLRNTGWHAWNDDFVRLKCPAATKAAGH